MKQDSDACRFIAARIAACRSSCKQVSHKRILAEDEPMIDQSPHINKRRRLNEGARQFEQTGTTLGTNACVSDVERAINHASGVIVASGATAKRIQTLDDVVELLNQNDRSVVASQLKRSNFIVNILMVLESSHQDVQLWVHTEKILRVLSAVAETGQASYLSENGLFVISKCLSLRGDLASGVRMQAALCLGRLAEIDIATRKAILSKAGVIQEFSYILTSPNSRQEELVHVAWAVAELCDRTAAFEFVNALSHWFMNNASYALSDSYATEILRCVVKALSRLYDGDEANIDCIARRGIATKLAHVVETIHRREQDVGDLMDSILRCLGNFASGSNSHRHTLIKDGTLHMVMPLLQDTGTDTSVRAAALRFVANIATGTPEQVRELEPFVSILTEFAGNKVLGPSGNIKLMPRKVTHAALRAITNICKHGSNSQVEKTIAEHDVLELWAMYMQGYKARDHDLLSQILTALDNVFDIAVDSFRVYEKVMSYANRFPSLLENFQSGGWNLKGEVSRILSRFAVNIEFVGEDENRVPSPGPPDLFDFGRLSSAKFPVPTPKAVLTPPPLGLHN